MITIKAFSPKLGHFFPIFETSPPLATRLGYDTLRDLVTFAQFKKRENEPWGM